jgi:hypothetical protein
MLSHDRTLSSEETMPTVEERNARYMIHAHKEAKNG